VRKIAVQSLQEWWRFRQRRAACRSKYGDACPHLERHAKRWTTPGLGVPIPRAESGDVADREDESAGRSE
jgi:hypothetical protein